MIRLTICTRWMLILGTTWTQDKAIYPMYSFHWVPRETMILPKLMNSKSSTRLKKTIHTRKNKTHKRKWSKSIAISQSPKTLPRKQWASTSWPTKKSAMSSKKKTWSSTFPSTVTRSKSNNWTASRPKSPTKTTPERGLKPEDPSTGPRRDSQGPPP